jgi:hypothetical protein
MRVPSSAASSSPSSSSQRWNCALPAERRVHDHHVRAEVGRELERPAGLGDQVGAEHPPGQQQERAVDDRDGDALDAADLRDPFAVLGRGVLGDHQLDAVVARPRR